jgi:hypothetical protein
MELPTNDQTVKDDSQSDSPNDQPEVTVDVALSDLTQEQRTHYARLIDNRYKTPFNLKQLDLDMANPVRHGKSYFACILQFVKVITVLFFTLLINHFN